MLCLFRNSLQKVKLDKWIKADLKLFLAHIFLLFILRNIIRITSCTNKMVE